MPGPWDSVMKRLVKVYAQHFAMWLMASAIFIRALDIELQSQHIFADALLEVMVKGQRALLHSDY